MSRVLARLPFVERWGRRPGRAVDEPLDEAALVALRIRRVSLWAGIVMVLSMVVVLGRVLQLQVRPSQRLVEHAPLTSSIRPEIANRGDVVDRRGRVLATSRVGCKLFVDPQEVEDVDSIAIELARLLDRNPVEFDRLLQERLDKRYCVLVPLLTETEVELVRTADFKGVGLESVLVRHRPYGDLAAAFIGKVGADHVGLTGVERLFDRELTGEPGQLRYLRDVRRRAMWVEPVGYQPSADGHAVRVSLDVEIQRIAEEELSAGVEAFNAGGGRAIVLDAQTGEVLAMTDLLRPRRGRDFFTTDPARDQDATLGRLRSVTDPYEPGSTFKPFVWAVATELGVTKSSEVLNIHNGSYRTSRGRRIRDAHPYDELTWDGVLVKSSNIGMAQIAERLTDAQMQKAIRSFGFGVPTGLGLPGETSGLVTPPEKWSHYSQTSVSYGHEIAVTPLQMVRAFAAFCRDGSLPTLTFLAPFDDGVPQAYIEQRPILESTAEYTRNVMHRVMLEGTGRKANEGAKYRMFGKSGTAELPKPTGGGYFKDRYIGSFIAGAPLDEPRLIVLAIVEDPDRSIGHYGGVVCGPIVRNIMNRSLEYLGVRPDTTAGAAAESNDDLADTMFE